MYNKAKVVTGITSGLALTAIVYFSTKSDKKIIKEKQLVLNEVKEDLDVIYSDTDVSRAEEELSKAASDYKKYLNKAMIIACSSYILGAIASDSELHKYLER